MSKRVLVWAAVTVTAATAAWIALFGMGGAVFVALVAEKMLIVPVGIMVATAALFGGVAYLTGDREYRSAREDRAFAGGIVGVVIGFMLIGVVMVSSSWVTMARNYANTVVEGADAMVELDQRAPYPVARELLQRNTAGLTGELVDVTYVVNHPAGSPRWTGIVAGQTFVNAQGVVEWDPTTGEFTMCEFASGVRSPNGIFANSLKRAARNVEINSTFKNEDLYGVCEGGEPTLYWPFGRVQGLYSVRTVPAGVLTMDTNGTITVETGAIEAGEYPGPVVPMGTVRDAVNSNRSTIGWVSSTFAKRDFYVATGVVGNSGAEDGTDAADPNVARGNYREFLLSGKNGEMVFVTPLSVVGSDPSTRAIAIARADVYTPGRMPEVTIVELDETMPSPAEVDQSIRSSLPELGWAAGLEVIEVTPISATTQVATIGFDLKVSYTVEIGNGGSVTITSRDGAAVSGATPERETPESEIVDLSTMTAQQLNELLRQIGDELTARSR